MPDIFANVPPLTAILALLFPLVMIAAMVSDVRHFRIPNSYSLILAGACPIAFWSSGFSGLEILFNFAVATVVLIIGIGLFSFGLLGGGDVKLFAAATFWTGLPQLIDFVFYTAVFGGALAVTMLIFRKLPLHGRLPLAFLQRQHEADRDIPYALAIGLAGLIVFPHLPVLVRT